MIQDALLGFDAELEHLDGSILNISRKGTTWNGFRQRLLNKGMPKYNYQTLQEDKNRGALIVTFDVDFPDLELTEEQKKEIELLLNQGETKPHSYNGLTLTRQI